MDNKNYYVLLSPARAGDWGECLLVPEDLGKYLYKEYDQLLQIDEKVLNEMLDEIKKDNENISQSDAFELLEERIEDLESLYYFITNLIYDKESDCFLKFHSLAKMVNFVIENEIKIIGDLDY